ncbi:hypothetical protein [Microbacterium sp. RURRCA19A]|uniref:hypothetical protein n=1 Tax=Microbacterium sp. RURRCA19A TaxID=1907391 RepID=UPI0009555AF5|nr:hypothetical protein [Microbacterium sp. RURRCA19A]SIS13046.1 hypothetical protein SAMN05880568_2911 [Microbacterium sp. RURRCA19A]
MIPPAAGSGLDGLPARVALLFVWMTGIAHGLEVHAFAVDTGLVLLAYALAAVAAVAVTLPPRGRLPAAPTAAVVSLGATIAVIVLTSPDVSHIVWLFDFASYPIALLIPRGRPLVGGVCLVLLIAAGTGWALTSGEADPSWGRIVSGPLVAGAIGFIWLSTLRRIVRRETSARSDRERAEMLSDAAVTATRAYQDELARVTDESEPLLRDIAAADHLDERTQRRIGIVEGRIRDRLRAGDLFHPRVTAAIDAAREGGVRVLLIGGGGVDDEGISDELADRIVEILELPGLEHVTVRRLPPGRTAAVSAVAGTTQGTVRAAFDRSGNDAGIRPDTSAS